MGSDNKFNFGDSINIFFQEAREMLENMESCLLQLEKDFSDEDSIHALFRSIHTIKGSSGMFGFDKIEHFTHVVENILDDARNGQIELSSDLIGLLLECHDLIVGLLDLFEKQPQAELDVDTIARKEKLIERLLEYQPGKLPLAKDNAVAHVNEEPIENDEDSYLVESEYWHISLRFVKDVFKHGLDPRSSINYLNEIGEILNIVTITDELPLAEKMDPENCYIGFEISFNSDSADKKAIENVFEFFKEDCEIRIVPPKSNILEFVKLITELPEESMHIGEMLINIGSLTEYELKKALELQACNKNGQEEETDKKLIGEIMVDEKLVHEKVLNAALEKQDEIKKSEEKKKKSIRIDADKLDRLINLVGELVITGSNVKQHADATGDTELVEVVSVMTRLIEEIRDGTMNVRMVQIGDTFRRYERIARDLAKENGKKIELVIKGGETELDKTLIEKLSDPLMHLIRNAADHGIEAPNDRIASGKGEVGTIFLNAYHETGSIVIEVIDDGKGINKQRVLEKAIERGLVSADKQLSDEEIYKLVFEPGFSTAEKVTNISGRGVGMDVVKRNIESLRGMINVESIDGEGTCIQIHLPLTLAIIDGFMVQVGNSKYVLPLDMVVECVEVSNLESKEGGNFLNLRGYVLPYMRMRDFFKDHDDELVRENIIVLEYARMKAGLVVDKLIGECQTVIKPLGKIFDRLKWVSGSTILGTGEVALILDVPMLIHHIQKTEKSEVAQ